MKRRNLQWRLSFKKSYCIFILLSCILFITYAPSSFAAIGNQEASNASSPKEILLVYDPADTKLLETLTNLVPSCGKSMVIVSTEDYTDSLAQNYSYFILTSGKVYSRLQEVNKPIFCIGKSFIDTWPTVKVDILPTAKATIYDEHYTGATKFLHDFPVISDFEGDTKSSYGTIELSFNRTYPFAVKSKNYYYVPYVSPDNVSLLLLGHLLQDYLGNVASGKLYILLNKISAFDDLNLLSQTAATLYENGIPYIVNTMPIFEHYDYDAFKRFTQVLRYIQSKNGTVTLDLGLERSEIEIQISASTENQSEKYKQALLALQHEGVTPTNLIYPPYIFTPNTLQSIGSTSKSFGSLPFDSAIIYNLPESAEEIGQMIDFINHKWFSINDSGASTDHSYYLFNETSIDEAANASNASNMSSPTASSGSFSSFFEYGSHFLFIIIGITLFIFIGIIILGRYLYNRKFYK